MRIVGGAHKGRALVAPPGRETRPTSDRVRETIFNILAHSIDNFDLSEVSVVDVFAGTGALGFEALSKGIKVAAFYSHFPEKGTYLKYKRKGPFWTNSTSYTDFEKIVKKVINYPDKKWSSIVKKYSKEILAYDSENRIKKLIINKIKNKI